MFIKFICCRINKSYLIIMYLINIIKWPIVPLISVANTT